jgi:phosphoglucosamine mutase
MLRFGTDGVRGVALEELTAPLVRDLVRATVRVLGVPAVFVGRDTRESGRVLERAVVEGCAIEGVPVHLLGVAPTPAVAFACERTDRAGIAITASHNPWSDNGVKVFAPGGTKLSDDDQVEIERVWHSLGAEPTAVGIGTVHDASAVLEEYAGHRMSVAGPDALAGLRIAVDCAHGAMHELAPRVLRGCGAEVTVFAASPDGRNINHECGATSPEALAALVRAEGLDAGVAFDGDGDRLVVVAADGSLLDGDAIVAAAAADLAARGLLRNRAVAVTVMSNLGFHRAMADLGIDVVVTPVGDRGILAALAEHDLVLGGEQSGHIVHAAHATTGDGLLAAVLFLESVVRGYGSVAGAASVMERWPQVLLNVRTTARVEDPLDGITDVLTDAEAALGGDGRILVRSSGTESVVRVMVEARTIDVATRTARMLASAIAAAHGGTVETSH